MRAEPSVRRVRRGDECGDAVTGSSANRIRSKNGRGNRISGLLEVDAAVSAPIVAAKR